MKVSELFGRAGLEYPPSLGDIEIKEIVTDSRRASEGCLFLCIKGMTTDAHGYIDDAIKAGAAVIVTEQVREACVGGAAAHIVLNNTRQAEALLYNAWYGEPSKKLKIIGVTGTNGKTSTCTMLREIFEEAGYRCGMIGTVCSQTADGRALSHSSSESTANMTTPDPAELYAMLSQMVLDGVEYVFMEVSSHALALHKVDAIHFETAVFTNLTRDHLDFHYNMEEYFLAKLRLFDMCSRAVVNARCEYGQRIIEHIGTRYPALTFSVGVGDYCALDISSKGLGGSEYKLRYGKGELDIKLSCVGRFAIVNSLCAAAVALEHGITPETVARALLKSKGAEGRMEVFLAGDGESFSVIIDYAHTPDALEGLLLSVRELRRSREKITVLFGCGGDRDRGKRRQMARIASRLADKVIVTSDNSRGEDPDKIIADILRGIDKESTYKVIKDRREAIRYAVMNAERGEIIVLAGKGHERYEINSEGRVPFDERKIVTEVCRELDGR